MSDFTEGAVGTCLTHTAVTHPNHVDGAEVTKTVGALSVSIYIYHGFTEAAANTNPGHFSVLVKPEAAGTDEGWVEVRRFHAFNGTPVLATIDATEALGQTTLDTTNGEGANMTDGELVYITDATAAADGEWHYLLNKAPDADSVLIGGTAGLTNAKAANDEISSKANAWIYDLDLKGVAEWKVTFNHRGAVGANCAVFGRYIEVTDFE